jgi:predicted RNA-binding protein YlxR (DUF448 family)
VSPRRKCVGCGRIAPKSELVRIALTDQRSASDGKGSSRRAVLDRTGVMPGRGAYLCLGERPGEPNGDCLARARRSGAIGRALRSSMTVASEGLESVSR